MRIFRAVLLLCAVVGVGAGVAAVTGLLAAGGSGPHPFETLRGERTEIWGRGLYRHDTVFTAAGSRATDLVTLLLGLPLLGASALGYRRGSPRAGLLLLGTLGYFLYVYGGYALGAVAHNRLSLLHAVVFSAALWAVVLMFAAFPAAGRDALFPAGTPRLGPATLMLASAAVLLVVWGVPLLSSALTGVPPPGLGPYSTEFTMVLDLAVVAPAACVAGVLILRRRPFGYLLALSLLVLEVLLAPLVIAQTTAQLLAGVRFTVPEVLGPMGGFVVLAIAAGAVLVSVLRAVDAADGRPGPGAEH
ncbi:hypothetical protein [Kocuria sp. NPDC057446]|uniref:hypothetical protein n=1 Tax=Kocuria sp. NPDC057446 TaxID=3346137 RepID=UPI003676644D